MEQFATLHARTRRADVGEIVCFSAIKIDRFVGRKPEQSMQRVFQKRAAHFVALNVAARQHFDALPIVAAYASVRAKPNRALKVPENEWIVRLRKSIARTQMLKKQTRWLGRAGLYGRSNEQQKPKATEYGV
jgi:hypothetical protein